MVMSLWPRFLAHPVCLVSEGCTQYALFHCEPSYVLQVNMQTDNVYHTLHTRNQVLSAVM